MLHPTDEAVKPNLSVIVTAVMILLKCQSLKQVLRSIKSPRREKSTQKSGLYK